MFKYLTFTFIASFFLVGSIDAVPANEGSLMARAGLGGARGAGGVRAHPAARGQALQRTPALSRSALNNQNNKAAVAGYAAGSNNNSGSSIGYTYPSTAYYGIPATAVTTYPSP